jgi:sugar lactone lactonase YvrE
MHEKITIPNGISWNSRNDIMFLADSHVQTVYKFDYMVK